MQTNVINSVRTLIQSKEVLDSKKEKAMITNLNRCLQQHSFLQEIACRVTMDELSQILTSQNIINSHSIASLVSLLIESHKSINISLFPIPPDENDLILMKSICNKHPAFNVSRLIMNCNSTKEERFWLNVISDLELPVKILVLLFCLYQYLFDGKSNSSSTSCNIIHSSLQNIVDIPILHSKVSILLSDLLEYINIHGSSMDISIFNGLELNISISHKVSDNIICNDDDNLTKSILHLISNSFQLKCISEELCLLSGSDIKRKIIIIQYCWTYLQNYYLKNNEKENFDTFGRKQKCNILLLSLEELILDLFSTIRNNPSNYNKDISTLQLLPKFISFYCELRPVLEPKNASSTVKKLLKQLDETIWIFPGNWTEILLVLNPLYLQDYIKHFFNRLLFSLSCLDNLNPSEKDISEIMEFFLGYNKIVLFYRSHILLLFSSLKENQYCLNPIQQTDKRIIFLLNLLYFQCDTIWIDLCEEFLQLGSGS